MITPNVRPILLHLFSFFVFCLGLARCMYVWMCMVIIIFKVFEERRRKKFFLPMLPSIFHSFSPSSFSLSPYIHFFCPSSSPFFRFESNYVLFNKLLLSLKSSECRVKPRTLFYGEQFQLFNNTSSSSQT